MATKLIIINTDSVANPMTGGQKRTNALYNQYNKLGYSTRFIGLYHKENLGPNRKAGPHDIILNNVGVRAKSYILVADAILKDRQAYRRLTQKIKAYKPDVVQIENPFLLPVVKKLQSDKVIAPQIKLIYSSHNIEHRLLKNMPEGKKMVKTKSAVEYTKKLETETIQKVHTTIACTKSDAEEIKKMGGKNIVVANNGIAPIQYNSEAIKSVRSEYSANGFYKTAVFISSSHPPNVKGFLDMVGTKLGFLGFDTRVVLAGSVSAAVAGYIDEHADVVEKSCFYQRFAGYGIVSEEKLSAIIKLADIIILPVTSGGGSNLKTAEALQSRKPIVATTTAMRDYEHLIELPNVFIEDDPKGFQQKIVELTRNPPEYTFTVEQEKLIDSVLWENTLKDLDKVGVL